MVIIWFLSDFCVIWLLFICLNNFIAVEEASKSYLLSFSQTHFFLGRQLKLQIRRKEASESVYYLYTFQCCGFKGRQYMTINKFVSDKLNVYK